MSYKISRYGWLPDLPDERDHFYAAPVAATAVLPASADLRPQCPPVMTRASSAVAPPMPSPGQSSSTG
jgi:hypothetical protein